MKSEANFEHRSETYAGTLNEERKNQLGVRVLWGFPLLCTDEKAIFLLGLAYGLLKGMTNLFVVHRLG